MDKEGIAQTWNDLESIQEPLIQKVFNWLGEENVRWFSHVKGLKGEINCVLKLNFKKKGIPVHPIHFREGMQIRNFMRSQQECVGWKDFEFDSKWVYVIEACIARLKTK